MYANPRELTDSELKAVIDFVHDNGVACGGNWDVMFLSALQRGLPEYLNKLPKRNYSLSEVIALLANALLGIALREECCSCC